MKQTLDTTNNLFITHTNVQSFHLDIDKETLLYGLFLSLSSEETFNSKISLYFHDVHDLNLAEFGGGLTQFMHLKITQKSSGHDRERYLVEDLENSRVRFGCFDYDNIT